MRALDGPDLEYRVARRDFPAITSLAVIHTMRRSSTILLTRRVQGELQVYLVERSPKLRFFGGYWAFPGGVVDEVDELPEDADEHLAEERCAIRELFEETGVLIGPLESALPLEKRAALRASLVDLKTDAADWLPYQQAADGARADLHHLTTISTPEFAPVRHRTPFYQAELPAGQEPTIEIGELVDGRFWGATELIDAWKAGSIPVAPPALFLLDLLRDGDLEAFRERCAVMGAKLEAGQLHRAYFAPGVMLAPLATATLPPATTTNCVLIGEQRVFILDPATELERDRERLFETLDRWLVEGKTLGGVLLSHHHPDHVGAVQVTAERYGLEVFAHPETLARLDLGGVPSAPIEHGHKFDLGLAPDGSPGWTLEAFFTPGHALGHLVFIESRYRTAIVGDLVSTLSTIVIDPPEGHMATYLESLQAILDKNIGVLVPAHGAGARVGADVLRYHLRRRQEREAKLFGVLTGEGQTLEQLLPVVYDDAPQVVMPFAARSLLAGLQKLEEEQRIGHSEGLWSVTQ
jgi:ribonuclease/clavin/mitogillin